MYSAKHIIRVLQTLFAAFYLLFIIDFILSPYDHEETLLGNIIVYVLFAIFIAGYALVWKNIKMSGVLLMLWYIVLFAAAHLVWRHGAMTIFIGIPIFVLGIITFLFGVAKK